MFFQDRDHGLFLGGRTHYEGRCEDGRIVLNKEDKMHIFTKDDVRSALTRKGEKSVLTMEG